MGSEIEFGWFAYLILIGAFVAASVVALYRGRFGRALRDAGLWLLIMAVLIVGYAMRSELGHVGQRVFAVLVPGHGISSNGGETLEFAAGPDGHFLINGSVDGVPVKFVVDTGATTVLLTYQDAQRTGIDVGSLRFSAPVQTANGLAMAAPYTLRRVETGGISRSNVQALIAQPDLINASLLGMSFLSRLSSFEVRGDRLILHD
ncbi:MAG TPA: TIGR02281 family clan AA aspartic protease [Aestuariivirgaceae bacterium]|jgi:aspartyl protease family protein